jgi:uncharacterized protein (TIGR00369 family)
MTTPLPNLWPGNCFGCSPRNPHGLHLVFHRTGRGARTSCTLPAHLCGFEGIAHGGVVATLLDEAAAWALIAHAGRLGFTRTMNVTFHRPASLDAPLSAEGAVETCDAKQARTRAEVRSGDGTLLAEAFAEWTLMSLAAAARLFKLEKSRLEQFVAAIHPDRGK